MPVLFVSHCSPMNAIETNEYTKSWHQFGVEIHKPKTIGVVSANCLTTGTAVTAMEFPKTIHDFGGFPKALFDVNYSAVGNHKLDSAISWL